MSTPARTEVAARPVRSSFALPVAVGAVFFVAGVVQLTKSWPAIGDWAVAELIVRHAGRYLPLSGAYSATRGYDHPLPWMYAIEWLPYHLFGGRSSAAPATALWWNGAWAAFSVWLLAALARAGLAVVALFAILILGSRVEGVVLLLPWNPNLAVVPAFALLFVAWRVGVGEGWWLPMAVGLAVWCTGAHLGFLPFTAAVLLVASASLVVVTVVTRGRAQLRSLLRPAFAALGVGVILVAPMLFDLVQHGSKSNPARIVDLAGPNSPKKKVPAEQAVKVGRAELAIPPAWTRTAPPYDVYLYRPAARAPIMLVLVAIVGFVAWRRRARDELIGIALCLAGLLAATVGLAFVDDALLEPWFLLPAHVASAGLVAFVVWSGARSIAWAVRRGREPGDQSARVRVNSVGAMGLAVLAGGVTAIAVAGMHTPAHFQTISSTAAELSRPVERRFPDGAHLVVDGPLNADGYYSQALALQLDKAGYAVHVPDNDLYMYTRALAIPKDWVATTLTLQISRANPKPPKPGAQLVSSVVVPPGLTFEGRTLSVWANEPRAT